MGGELSNEAQIDVLLESSFSMVSTEFYLRERRFLHVFSVEKFEPLSFRGYLIYGRDRVGKKSLRPFLMQSDSASRKRPFSTVLFSTGFFWSFLSSVELIF